VSERPTLLSIPGDSAAALAAGSQGARTVVIDLEDVPDGEADAARLLVRYALEHVSWGDAEVLVRIAPMDADGPLDMREVAHLASGIVLPGTTDPDEVRAVAEALDAVEAERGLPRGSIGIVPALATSKAVRAAPDILAASPRVRWLMFDAGGGRPSRVRRRAVKERAGPPG